MQDPDTGFIPEQINWGVPDTTAANIDNNMYYGNIQKTKITQNPVLAWSLRSIYTASGNNTALLKEFVPPLVRYWKWWAATRTVSPHTGLVSILHGWESGMDASPLYDAMYNVTNPQPALDEMYPKFGELLLSYNFAYKWDTEFILHQTQANPTAAYLNIDSFFIVEDIGVNAIYGAGWGVLGDLAAEMGDTETAAYCWEQEELVTSAVINYAWRPDLGRFVSFYKSPVNGTWMTTEVESLQSVMVLALRKLPPNIAAAVHAQLVDPSKFWLNYPAPSVSKSEPSFNPVFSIDLMWRGPTWPIINWVVMEGLLQHGFNATLNEMMDKWIDMVKVGGIFEMYNPLTAESYGVEGLGMSCLIVDWLYRLNRA